ncbi:MAG: hypothetical protein D6820_09165 [Lentisphaerae bacterium]|nr:MAG: hypothetical protein D6820_09165 [Lentisphaerota bacterium]
MPFSYKIKCPECHENITIDENLVGTLYPCKQCHTNFTIPATAVIPGMILDDFLIEKRIGGGPRSDIFLVHSQTHQQNMVLKVFAPFLSIDKDAAHDYLVLCNHHVFTRIHHVIMPQSMGVSRGLAYVAMPWIKGEDLNTRFRRIGFFPESLLIEIGISCASLLHEVERTTHQNHGRIKPANLMYTELNDLVLLDFGINRVLENVGNVSEKALLCDFEPFCAPELLAVKHEQRQETVSSDIFSLGATLYFLATGAKPLNQVDNSFFANEENAPLFPRANELNPNITSEFAYLLERCMVSKDARFQTWEQFLQAMEEFRSSQISTQVLRVGSSSAEISPVPAVKSAPASSAPQPAHSKQRRSGRKIPSRKHDQWEPRDPWPNWFIPAVIAGFFLFVFSCVLFYHFFIDRKKDGTSRTKQGPALPDARYLNAKTQLDGLYANARALYEQPNRDLKKVLAAFKRLRLEAQRSPYPDLREHFVREADLYIRQLTRRTQRSAPKRKRPSSK